jgi:hypothetical protein
MQLEVSYQMVRGELADGTSDASEGRGGVAYSSRNTTIHSLKLRQFGRDKGISNAQIYFQRDTRDDSRSVARFRTFGAAVR